MNSARWSMIGLYLALTACTSSSDDSPNGTGGADGGASDGSPTIEAASTNDGASGSSGGAGSAGAVGSDAGDAVDGAGAGGSGGSALDASNTDATPSALDGSSPVDAQALDAAASETGVFDGGVADATSGDALLSSDASDGSAVDAGPTYCANIEDTAPVITDTHVAAAYPTYAVSADAPPDGTYFMTSYLFYTGASADTHMRKQTLVYSGGHVQLASKLDDGDVQHTNFNANFNKPGKFMIALGNCGAQSTELFTFGFDYAAGVLKLYNYQENRVEVWTKQ